MDLPEPTVASSMSTLSESVPIADADPPIGTPKTRELDSDQLAKCKTVEHHGKVEPRFVVRTTDCAFPQDTQPRPSAGAGLSWLFMLYSEN